MDEQGESAAYQVLQNLELSEEMVRDHIIRPHHILDAITGIETLETERIAPSPPSGRFYSLDMEGLGRDLQALLSSCLAAFRCSCGKTAGSFYRRSGCGRRCPPMAEWAGRTMCLCTWRASAS